MLQFVMADDCGMHMIARGGVKHVLIIHLMAANDFEPVKCNFDTNNPHTL